MRQPLRVLLLACVLTLTPSCAGFRLDPPAISNPVDAAQTPDQRAYALLGSYAALVETATDIVRDPSVPIEAKRALGRAEAVATPTAQALEAAFAAYLRARNGFEAASGGDQSSVSRAASDLSNAAKALGDAIAAARAPIAALEALVKSHGH
jgi:hypothetical protein